MARLQKVPNDELLRGWFSKDGKGQYKPLNPDVEKGLPCDLKQCTFPCMCQKLTWMVDFRQPLPPGADQEICKKWKEDEEIEDPKNLNDEDIGSKGKFCLTACMSMAQHIDAAAGADPYVCFKDVEEAQQLLRDATAHKEMWSGMSDGRRR